MRIVFFQYGDPDIPLVFSAQSQHAIVDFVRRAGSYTLHLQCRANITKSETVELVSAAFVKDGFLIHQKVALVVQRFDGERDLGRLFTQIQCRDEVLDSGLALNQLGIIS